MKANEKTLLAVKRYISEPEGYDMEEIISDLVYETGILKLKINENIKQQLVAPDECTIQRGEDYVCSLDDFIGAFSEKLINAFCNVLDSFVDEDIDDYLESED